MKNKLLICLFAFSAAKAGFAQLNVGTGQLFIQSGAVVSVQGDVTSSTDILGPGKLLLNGTANQNVNVSNFNIPNLEINNTANVTLTGSAKIGSSLLFTNGKILLGAFNLELADVATTSGAGVSKFVESGSTGKLLKDVTTNLSSYVMPVGSGTAYSPVQLTTTGANTGAIVGVQVKPVADPNKNIRSTDYLNRYWPITQTGLTGTLTAVGQYNDPTDITGSEAALNGIYYNGTNWSLAGSSLDAVNNLAGATITGAGGDLYAMNKFVLGKIKSFLQAPYNAGTGFMDDKLRNSGAYTAGTFPASNLIPLNDPYRSAPYAGPFTHVSNTNPEVITNSVLNDQVDPTTNIVDWVFVELRTTVTPGNTVVTTRSALLRRDGSIVDVDGVSPLYFQDVAAGSYVVSVRHRNHLGLSLNPANTSVAFDIASPSTTVDLTTASASALMGTPNVNYYNNGTYNFLYGGDANFNGSVKYSGSQNDRAKILQDLGGVEGNINTGYFSSDLNMNRTVKYSGSANDRAFILSNILVGAEGLTKNQSLPQ